MGTLVIPPSPHYPNEVMFYIHLARRQHRLCQTKAFKINTKLDTLINNTIKNMIKTPNIGAFSIAKLINTFTFMAIMHGLPTTQGEVATVLLISAAKYGVKLHHNCPTQYTLENFYLDFTKSEREAPPFELGE